MWYSALTPNNINTLSSYVSRNGEVLASSSGGIHVRPTGANSTYPPSSATGEPEGFHVLVNLGKEGVLDVSVEKKELIQDFGVYYRWTGSLSGRVRGGPELKGVALYEELVYLQG